jgi:hypothetical protein
MLEGTLGIYILIRILINLNDGEYIILENELMIGGIKMPKDRAWYYNKDDKYLGTDYLTIK